MEPSALWDLVLPPGRQRQSGAEFVGHSDGVTKNRRIPWSGEKNHGHLVSDVLGVEGKLFLLQRCKHHLINAQ